MDQRDRLLEGLTESQRHAVCLDAAPLGILAGAGSGKTRVLTRRIAWRVSGGDADASHVLALTFTRKAAAELGRRLRDLGVRDRVAAGTFHGVALAQLRRRWADRGEVAPKLLERKVGLLARLAGDRRGELGPRQLADLAGEIEWAKARLVGPAAYAEAAGRAARRPPIPAAEVARLYQAYEEAKTRRGLVDFDDLLRACAEAIEGDPGFAGAQRWKFRHLFVDEFQDVNPAQERLLRAWLGDGRDLCVVGDPDQAIYGWNGADPTALSQLGARFPGATVVRLEDNWRSSPQVLAVAGAVLGGRAGRSPAGGGAGGSSVGAGAGRSPARAGGARSPAGAGRPFVRAHRPDGPVPTVSAYDSDRAEARGISRRLRQSHRPGRPWSDLAVLVRTNSQITLLEEALQAAGIPHRVRGGGGLLTQPAVREVLDALARSPGLPLTALVAELSEEARGGGGDQTGGGDERREALLSLVRLAGEYRALDPLATAGGFLPWLTATLGPAGGGGGDDRGRRREEASGGAVELATFHRAKGLEWPVVMVGGLEQGLVPIGHATTPAAEAEERRLLYVALTRAELELHCSWAARRTFGKRTLRRTPSPYLQAIEATCAALAGARPGAEVPELVAAGRRSLHRARSRRASAAPSSGGADPAAEEVMEALRSWRSAAARASGVPAYVILHDATLASVASALPSTPGQLQALPGIGPLKTARYGEALLEVLSRCRRSA